MKNQETDTTEIGKRLDELADALGVTLAQMAKAAGMGRPDILYAIRSGRTAPSFDTISRILNAYPDVDANFLFGKSEQPLKPQPQQLPALPLLPEEMATLAALGKMLQKYAGN